MKRIEMGLVALLVISSLVTGAHAQSTSVDQKLLELMRADGKLTDEQ